MTFFEKNIKFMSFILYVCTPDTVTGNWKLDKLATTYKNLILTFSNF